MKSSNPFVTNPTLAGTADRLALVWATIAAGKIVAMLGVDPQYTDWVALGILSLGATVIGWLQNRPTLIAATVANMNPATLAQPGVSEQVVAAAGNVPNPDSATGKTIVVTSEALAVATGPGAPTVVSSQEAKVTVDRNR